MKQTSSMMYITKKFAFPLWEWYLGGLIFMGITSYITLEIPTLSKQVINALVNDPGNISSLEGLSLLIISLGLLQIAVRSISRILIFKPGRQLEANIRNYFFSRFLQLPQSFIDNFGMGDLISRLSNDIGKLRAFYAFGILQMMNIFFLTIFSLQRMIETHLMLTVYTLIPLLTMILVARIGTPRLHAAADEGNRNRGTLTNKVTEAFVNVHTVQSYVANEAFINRMEEENLNVYNSNLRMVLIRSLMFPMIMLLAGFSSIVVLYYGGLEITAGRLSVGDIMAFMAYLGILGFPLAALGMVITLTQSAKAATQRLQELASEEIERAHKTPTKQSIANTDTAPLLEIKNLSFTYPTHEEEKQRDMALQNINMIVMDGEKIGLCGPVGGGKSTLFQLITRIYEPPEGTIFWRGQDVLSLEPEKLRQNIGYALQTAHLFSDSIKNNLLFGHDNKTFTEEVVNATKAAQIYDDIEEFPNKWETEIGEKGVRLSGGQKQRLALSRILLAHPKLYLLDDITSALDQKTEASVLEEIEKTKNSMIICSHRVSALKSCDKIFLLQEGKIISSGSLQDLKEQSSESFLSE